MNDDNNNNRNKNINSPLVVGILIFDQVELLDVTGPFEVFSVTRLNEKEKEKGGEWSSSPFKPLLIAETLNQISTIGGLRLSPDVYFETCPRLDLYSSGWIGNT